MATIKDKVYIPDKDTGINGQLRVSDQAFNDAVSMVQANKPVYQGGSFDDQLRGIYDKIQNREPFSYDVNADPLYQQYKDTYVQQGKLAMKDTMGKAAGLTGGYGSSYGQQAGQQAYDAKLQGMTEVIPELYDLARQRYQAEGDALNQQASLVGNLRDTEYNRYRDQMSDWNNDMTRAQQQDETKYNREQQQYKIDLARAETLAAYGDFSGYAALYGDEQAAGMKQTWINSNPDLAYKNGLIDEQQYYKLTGAYPVWYQRQLDQQAAAARAAAASGGGYSGGAGSGKAKTQDNVGYGPGVDQQEFVALLRDPLSVDRYAGGESVINEMNQKQYEAFERAYNKKKGK